jgi:hypothetical protein
MSRQKKQLILQNLVNICYMYKNQNVGKPLGILCMLGTSEGLNKTSYC